MLTKKILCLRNNNLFKRNNRNLSGGLTSQNICAARSVDDYFTIPVLFNYISNYLAVCRKPDLGKYSLEINGLNLFDAPVFQVSST